MGGGGGGDTMGGGGGDTIRVDVDPFSIFWPALTKLGVGSPKNFWKGRISVIITKFMTFLKYL